MLGSSTLEHRANTILEVYNPHVSFLYLYDRDSYLAAHWEPGEEQQMSELLATCRQVAEQFQKPVIISGKPLDNKGEMPYYVVVKHREGPVGDQKFDWNPALFIT